MRKLIRPSLLALCLAGPAAAAPARQKPSARPAAVEKGKSDPEVVSTGQEVPAAKLLVPESPTVVVFMKPTSTLERGFLEELRERARDMVKLRVVQLKTGMEPIARQYEITETPTAIVFDRRGRQIAKTADSEAIRAGVMKAAEVMRIDWVTEGDPRMEVLRRTFGGRGIPGILRTMSLQPEWMDAINVLSQRAHFSDTALKRRTKEMIATYVSALNKCKY
jgi:hypothetical protein